VKPACILWIETQKLGANAKTGKVLSMLDLLIRTREEPPSSDRCASD
jgi:hypothetical protein